MISKVLSEGEPTGLYLTPLLIMKPTPHYTTLAYEAA